MRGSTSRVQPSSETASSCSSDSDEQETEQEEPSAEQLRRRVSQLEQLLAEASQQKKPFSYSDIENNDCLLCQYTGLPNNETFAILCDLIKRFDIDNVLDWKVNNMSIECQLLLTLMKFKLNLPHFDLAYRFGVSVGTVSNIFVTMVWVLYQVQWESIMAKSIPSRQKCQESVPLSSCKFPNCRLIIECTEVSIDVPGDLNHHCSTYSNHKGRATFKALVACAPNGVLVYASDLYGGSTHDKAITKDCGILDCLDTGDAILADKGFTIRDLLPAGVTVNMPAFLCHGQFSATEVDTNKRISSVRIHIERAIQRIKIFKIFNKIPWQHRKIANKLFKVCVASTNLQKNHSRT